MAARQASSEVASSDSPFWLVAGPATRLKSHCKTHLLQRTACSSHILSSTCIFGSHPIALHQRRLFRFVFVSNQAIIIIAVTVSLGYLEIATTCKV